MHSFIFADTGETLSILRPSRCNFLGGHPCPNLHLHKSAWSVAGPQGTYQCLEALLQNRRLLLPGSHS